MVLGGILYYGLTAEENVLGETTPTFSSAMIWGVIHACAAGFFGVGLIVVGIAHFYGDNGCQDKCGGFNTEAYIFPLSGFLLFVTVSHMLLSGLCFSSYNDANNIPDGRARFMLTQFSTLVIFCVVIYQSLATMHNLRPV
jgi:hypothetical protein